MFVWHLYVYVCYWNLVIQHLSHDLSVFHNLNVNWSQDLLDRISQEVDCYSTPHHVQNAMFGETVVITCRDSVLLWCDNTFTKLPDTLIKGVEYTKWQRGVLIKDYSHTTGRKKDCIQIKAAVLSLPKEVVCFTKSINLLVGWFSSLIGRVRRNLLEGFRWHLWEGWDMSQERRCQMLTGADNGADPGNWVCAMWLMAFKSTVDRGMPF